MQENSWPAGSHILRHYFTTCHKGKPGMNRFSTMCKACVCSHWTVHVFMEVKLFVSWYEAIYNLHVFWIVNVMVHIEPCSSPVSTSHWKIGSGPLRSLLCDLGVIIFLVFLIDYVAGAPLCFLCDDEPSTVKFIPCGHVVMCSERAVRTKKCPQCQVGQTDSLMFWFSLRV